MTISVTYMLKRHCGPDCDKINKTSLSFGPRAHTFKFMTKM